MFVYIIKETGTNFCKIGHSIHPETRLKQAQTYNPRKLVLYAAYNVGTTKLACKIEKHLHRNMFRLNHVRDEWFSLTQDHLNILHDWIKHYAPKQSTKVS